MSALTLRWLLNRRAQVCYTSCQISDDAGPRYWCSGSLQLSLLTMLEEFVVCLIEYMYITLHWEMVNLQVYINDQVFVVKIIFRGYFPTI